MPPGLFGLTRSNRDFTKADSWGKNQFNSSFPASMLAWMGSKGIAPKYVRLGENGKIEVAEIPTRDLLGADWNDPGLVWNFEVAFEPFRSLVGSSSLARIDLVVFREMVPTVALEVKLTAIPDQATFHLTEDRYAPELVVRPDSIAYLALSIARTLKAHPDAGKPLDLFDDSWTWGDEPAMALRLGSLSTALTEVCRALRKHQSPLVLQPIWKTVGKSGILADQCLDAFVWSDLGFASFVLELAETEGIAGLDRYGRSVVWLAKMLIDFRRDGVFDPRRTTDNLVYGVRNDKAFAANGRQTIRFLACPELVRPRIPRSAIREIVLGGGEKLLSPERRLDAVLSSNPGLFL